MEALPFIILLVLIILGLPIVLAIWLIVRVADARNRIGGLSQKVDWLELELLRMKRNPPAATAETKMPVVAVPSSSQPQPASENFEPTPPPPPVVPPEPVIPPGTIVPPAPVREILEPQSPLGTATPPVISSPPFIAPEPVAEMAQVSTHHHFDNTLHNRNYLFHKSYIKILVTAQA